MPVPGRPAAGVGTGVAGAGLGDRGQPGNHSASRAADPHPGHRHFGQATPRPRNHTTVAAGIPDRDGHSPVAATLPSAKPQVQVERPQRSEDERPGGAARRRPYSATRNARSDPPARPLKPQLRTNPGQPLDSNNEEDSLCVHVSVRSGHRAGVRAGIDHQAEPRPAGRRAHRRRHRVCSLLRRQEVRGDG